MPRDLPSASRRQEYLVEEKEHGRRATTQRTALLEAQQEVRRLFQELVRQPWGGTRADPFDQLATSL